MPISFPVASRTRTFLFAGVVLGALLPSYVFAQSYPQPYNSQDPQNYSSPASQTYQGQYPQQTVYPSQQGVYPGQQGVYPGQQGYANDQQGYPQQQQGYGDPNQQQYGAPYAGQQLVQQQPPPLPEYDQPEAPGDGYIWTPGYWAWGPGGYYWVAGQWSLPPFQGALYTPGYWGDYDGGYFWNAGYWGPVVGFYGGINYGFGYFGTGFYGGYWRGGRFCYNGLYNHLGPGFRGGYYNQRIGGFSSGYHFSGGRAIAIANVSRGFNGGSYRGGQVAGGQINAGRGFSSGAQTPSIQSRAPFQGNSHSVAAVPGSFNHTQNNAPLGNTFRGGFPQQAAPQYHAQPAGNPGGGGFHGGAASAPAHMSSGGGGGSHGGGGGHR